MPTLRPSSVCVLAFEFGRPEPQDRRSNWSHVVTSRRGVPDVPEGLRAAGCLGDRARLNANFRDEYYGMIPAVGDHDAGPRLITSGLIDPGRSWWGRRSITFAKQRYDTPRVDLARLDDDMVRWARRRLVPKVLVANQTRIVEAVCDPKGDWLPAVPVLGVYPSGAHWDDGGRRSEGELAASAGEIAAVLTSPVASVWLWHRGAGTGLSADAIRLSPVNRPLGRCDPTLAGDARSAAVAVRRSRPGSGRTRAGRCPSVRFRSRRRVRHRRRRSAVRLVVGVTGADRVAAAAARVTGAVRAIPASRPPSTTVRGRPTR